MAGGQRNRFEYPAVFAFLTVGRGGCREVRSIAVEDQAGDRELLPSQHRHRPTGSIQQHGRPHHPPRLRYAGPRLSVPETQTGITRLASAKVSESLFSRAGCKCRCRASSGYVGVYVKVPPPRLSECPAGGPPAPGFPSSVLR